MSWHPGSALGTGPCAARPGRYADWVRALLLVNPTATTVSTRAQEVIARALSTEVELDVAETRYRGHAMALARHGATEGYDVVVTLGGDGTVNEAVNGILTCSRSLPARPALGVIPGGNANVFARALGLPRQPVEATAMLLQSVHQWTTRTIGLGRADGRYFTFCAGLGIDAEVIRAVEGQRASGRRSSPALYVSTAIRHFFGVTDRWNPALRVEAPGRQPLDRIFLGVVANATPWTYLGPHPVEPTPQASFDAGLDFLGLRGLGTLATFNQIRQFLTPDGRPTSGRSAVTRRDLSSLTIVASRPIAFQIDGDYIGERERVRFCAAPEALHVIAPPAGPAPRRALGDRRC